MLAPLLPLTESEPTVDLVVARGRAAAAAFRDADQARVDRVMQRLAEALADDGRNLAIATTAVRATGMGRARDTALALGARARRVAAALSPVPSVGAIGGDPAEGITDFARPAGLVLGLVDAVDPLGTVAELALIAVKARAALVLSPSPIAAVAIGELVRLLREQLSAAGAPADLLQTAPLPVQVERSRQLMLAADAVTGHGVRHGMAADGLLERGGRMAGAVPVIIDDGADVDLAVSRILASKLADNGASCLAETVLLATPGVHDRLLDALRRQGGAVLAAAEVARAAETLWRGGKLNRTLIGRDPRVLAIGLGLAPRAVPPAFFVLEEPAGEGSPVPAQPLSLLLGVRRVPDLAAAVELVRARLAPSRAEGVCAIHGAGPGRAEALARAVDAAIVVHDQGVRTALAAHALLMGGRATLGWCRRDAGATLLATMLRQTSLLRPPAEAG